MTDSRSLLKLTAEQGQESQRWVQSRTLPPGDVFRARLILALTEGTSYREMGRIHPTVRFHFTSTYSSWLNPPELWFAKIQREM